MKPKVFVSRKIPEAGLNLLKDFEVRVWGERRAPSKKELIENARDADALLSTLSDPLDDEVLRECGKLKIIAQYTVGFDNIDVNAATNRGIVVTNTAGTLTDTTADLAFALLLSAARRIPEADRDTRAGKWVIAWEPLCPWSGAGVYGKTLGVIGMGRIGFAVAKRARGFDMKIVYYDCARNAEAEKAFGARFVSLDELLKESDFITIHVSLNAETRQLIGARELGLMKKTAFLINTSRGPVIDEKALCEALKEKKIAGAGLDVFVKEPVEASNPLLKLDNIVVAPHIGSASNETRALMAELAAKNILAFFAGRKPPNAVNPVVFEKLALK